MISASINYNVNIQFDPVTPQAGKPTNLSLVVTEQKVEEPIKEFDIIHDKIMHLVIFNSQDLSYFAHIHPKLNTETGISISLTHSQKQVNTRCGRCQT
jgi:AAA15 family ATPase/GTPase